jgi:hypothetical protein
MIRRLERIRVARDPGAEVCIVNVDGNGQAAEGRCCATMKWVETQKDDSDWPLETCLMPGYSPSEGKTKRLLQCYS